MGDLSQGAYRFPPTMEELQAAYKQALYRIIKLEHVVRVAKDVDDRLQDLGYGEELWARPLHAFLEDLEKEPKP